MRNCHEHHPVNIAWAPAGRQHHSQPLQRCAPHRHRRTHAATRASSGRPLLLLLATLALLHVAGPPLKVTAAAVQGDIQETDTFISDTERFPGWKGTLPGVKYATEASGDPNRARTLAHGSLGQVEWSGEVEQLSWSPRLYLYRRFLSDQECDHLMNKARSHLQKSEVVDNETGQGKSDSVRTSSGAFFAVGEDPVISRIEERIARVSFLPIENGEGLQVLRYEKGQEYKPHHDFFWDKINSDPAHGGQRIATVLMYLTTPEEGGETVFPQGRPASSGPGWSECAKQGLSVKSRRGDAVLFYGLHPNGTTDLASEHGSCPTLKGEKWSSTKWIHVASLTDGSAAEAGDAGCVDAERGCEDWAWADECTKNPAYMLNKCKKSCGTCNKTPSQISEAVAAAKRGQGAGDGEDESDHDEEHEHTA